jgi:hypothetical protein
MPLAGRLANVKITSQVATTSTDLAATRSTGLPTGYVQIDNVALRHFDPEGTVEVYKDGVLVGSTLYSVNPITGKFTWVTGNPDAGTYTVDVDVLTASDVTQARSWTLEVNQELFDISHFGSGGWRKFMADMAGARIGIGKYFVTADFIDFITDGSRFIIEMHVDGSGNRFECFARPAQDTVNVAVGSITTETLSLVSDGIIHYSTA